MRATVARAGWGVFGVTAVLLEAEVRLATLAYQGVVEQFEALPAAVALVWCVLNAWLEGYRGFQRRFVPMALDRAFSIDPRSIWETVLAPLKVMGLWHADGKVMRRAWTMVLGIAALVWVVRHLPQPWRGVVDAGVVVGLGWGTAALVLGFLGRARALLAR